MTNLTRVVKSFSFNEFQDNSHHSTCTYDLSGQRRLKSRTLNVHVSRRRERRTERQIDRDPVESNERERKRKRTYMYNRVCFDSKRTKHTQLMANAISRHIYLCIYTRVYIRNKNRFVKRRLWEQRQVILGWRHIRANGRREEGEREREREKNARWGKRKIRWEFVNLGKYEPSGEGFAISFSPSLSRSLCPPLSRSENGQCESSIAWMLYRIFWLLRLSLRYVFPVVFPIPPGYTSVESCGRVIHRTDETEMLGAKKITR